jgi:hypothetical protein
MEVMALFFLCFWDANPVTIVTFLYNKINKTRNIYNLNYHKCKLALEIYLQSLTYDKTEELFLICK